MPESFPPKNWLSSIPSLLLGCAVLQAVVNPLPAQSPGPNADDPAQTARWIERLGSRNFSEREQAMKELESLGAKALPSLRFALKSAIDAETRRRLQLLIGRLADKELTTRLLAATRVCLDFKHVRLDEAVAELAKQSGGLIHDGEWFDGTARFVTLSTGETTFWEAFHQLCEKSGLVENETIMGPFRPERDTPDPREWRTIVAAAPGIHLKPGKAIPLPTYLSGSVRFRWLGAKPSRDGAVDVRLEVSGEPRLRGLACGGRVEVITAFDNQGQTREVTIAPPPSPGESFPAKMLGHRGGGWILVLQNGTSLKGRCFGPAPEVTAGPVVITLRMAAADKPARRLKELTAKLTLATNVDASAPLTVDNILQAAGKSVDGTDGSRIKVERVQRVPAKNEIRVDVVWSRPYGPGPFGTRSGAGSGHMVWKDGIMKMGSADGEGSPGALEGAPRLLDTDGKSLALVEWTCPGWTVTRAEMAQRVTLVYRSLPDANPSELVVPGQRTFRMEVPFTFKEVPVPY